ncbi:Haloacid dehalogenase-like hydrolase (HAD) superfamily protein [Rhynchospora pubera]|uniref:Haloacid dehalogenase-like hydrolase (HAD) superfamily protein n=1 Tax=Rhynchospora pubera TaxID=906938 RepID=A0AAV8F3Q7_9POAL|nr:Haloacid dehalogenase-like hydrolase (HAD) superfamily protein [Rhynchospora pubera]
MINIPRTNPIFSSFLTSSVQCSSQFSEANTPLAMEACALSRCLLLPRSVSFAKCLPSPSPSLLCFLRHGSFSSSKFSNPSRVLSPAPGASLSSSSSGSLALLFEVEGVIADIYRFGNREAFNVAFQKLGLDCANWPEPVYADLMRRSGGDEENMLTLFFNRIGWPTSLPTNEKDSFVKSVLREKKKALEDHVSSSNIPLRPGVESFIDDALKEGIHMVMVTTYGRNGEKTARALVEKLGQDRVSKIKIVGKKEVEESFYGQLILGKGFSSSLDEQLLKEAQKAASKEKQRIAEEVASILKLSVDISTTPSEGFEMVLATLRAGAELAGLPVQNCVLLSGSQTGVLAAERVAMPCVVIRNSLTARAEFRSAKIVIDGFGGADLTISKLLSKIWSSK